jgi:YegS/Rv2252/BmrU family lipid kinase
VDRRVKLIFNHHADNGRGWRIASALQATIEHMGGAEWTGTEYPTHATELAKEAAEQGFDVVVAIGGDGTVHEVVNGLMQVNTETRPMLSAVPIGNGNDFCANAGVESDPEVAILRAFSGEPRSLDIGVVQDGSGRVEYWDNVLGIGFDAAATINSLSINRLEGTAMYFVAAVKTILRDHHAPHFKIRTDAEEIDDKFLLVALCNGRREGGGFILAPDALPDDGVLNYATVGWLSRLKMFRMIPEFMRGTHGRFKEVNLGEFRELELEADHSLLIHTDGEIFAHATNNVRELTVKVLPKAIRLVG